MAYDVNETDLTREIEKIKKRKLKASAMIPPQQQARKTLVLDLDETLVHTTFKKPKRYDFTSELLTNGRKVKAYVQKRFGL